jgi:predicted metal-dependent hydrolase
MITDPTVMKVRGVEASVVRKEIKNLHLGVYPPGGHVRVAAPVAVSDSAVRAAIVSRLPWIRRQQASFRRQARESRREVVSGESHWYLGRRYRLRVVEAPGRPRVTVATGSILERRCRPRTDTEHRAAILDRWYRDGLRERVQKLLETWAPALGVELAD